MMMTMTLVMMIAKMVTHTALIFAHASKIFLIVRYPPVYQGNSLIQLENAHAFLLKTILISLIMVSEKTASQEPRTIHLTLHHVKRTHGATFIMKSTASALLRMFAKTLRDVMVTLF